MRGNLEASPSGDTAKEYRQAAFARPLRRDHTVVCPFVRPAILATCPSAAGRRLRAARSRGAGAGRHHRAPLGATGPGLAVLHRAGPLRACLSPARAPPQVPARCRPSARLTGAPPGGPAPKAHACPPGCRSAIPGSASSRKRCCAATSRRTQRRS